MNKNKEIKNIISGGILNTFDVFLNERPTYIGFSIIIAGFIYFLVYIGSTVIHLEMCSDLLIIPCWLYLFPGLMIMMSPKIFQVLFLQGGRFTEVPEKDEKALNTFLNTLNALELSDYDKRKYKREYMQNYLNVTKESFHSMDENNLEHTVHKRIRKQIESESDVSISDEDG